MSNPSAPAGEFAGRRILLTGATGSIGRATALRLVESGAHVVLNGRDATKLEKLAGELPSGSCTLAPFDLTDCDGIPGWMTKLAEKDGPFAGVAHVAGIYSIRPLRTVTVESIEATLHANVTTAILLGKGLRQKVCHVDGASFVLVSSTAYKTGGGGNVAYAASKGAVMAAAKGMARELIRDKIRVNCVVPSLIDSEMLQQGRKMVPPESWAIVVAQQPLGLGHPDDVAYAIKYMLSDRTRWMTGTAMDIDGGLSLA